MLADKFIFRHLGSSEKEQKQMLKKIGVQSIEELIKQTIPEDILLSKPLKLSEPPLSEYELKKRLLQLAAKNKQKRSFIGMGYYGTMMPPVLQRNILENPVWYTSYTPYQAEISQGRLEALIIYQTVITELTAMEVANASMLDDATAAAEAMSMAYNIMTTKKKKNKANKIFIDKKIFPHILDVIITRAEPFGIEIIIDDYQNFVPSDDLFAIIVQYPNDDGKIIDYSEITNIAHTNEITVIAIADLLSLALITPPGQWNADIVVGSTQRFGLPMAFGGPHTGYFATRKKFIRKMPGRIIGITRDKNGKLAYRMTLQTREQHIRREKATSNICTAQALMAILSGFYALYHGKQGLKNIATQIHSKANILANKLKKLGYSELNTHFFDTLKIKLPTQITSEKIKKIALENNLNFRYFDNSTVGISIDEITTIDELNNINKVFATAIDKEFLPVEKIEKIINIPQNLIRKSDFLRHSIFNKYRTETEMMRYIKRLERKDISLVHSMIPLGSCTMKLNSAISLSGLTLPGFTDIHPFAPSEQTTGYQQLIKELKEDIKAITGMADVCFQPNSGAAGEYTGMQIIRAFHKHNNQQHRNVMLIPASAHGTNPASAKMSGMEIVVIKTDQYGNIDFDDLKNKAQQYKDRLAGFMVTYPSTHGVFESKIKQMCDIVHKYGGLVYMDGANMNAQIGYTNPATIGADLCHLNLHKTFSSPHGGGGPGVGPVAVAKHLVDFLPSHSVVNTRQKGIGAVASAPYGSALLLTIAYAYIKMLGAEGLKKATQLAILNANYLASQLQEHYPILYKGENGRVAHEFIIDLRKFKHQLDITEIDVAKRLIDYGFHAPTVSFPVPGTLMIEPTESESKTELDKFIAAMINIRKEIQLIEKQKFEKNNNPLKNAPHPEYQAVDDNWKYPYTRTQAVYPLEYLKENKFWINVARIDEAFGDRYLYCNYIADNDRQKVLEDLKK